jgi:hypothetical protein
MQSTRFLAVSSGGDVVVVVLVVVVVVVAGLLVVVGFFVVVGLLVVVDVDVVGVPIPSHMPFAHFWPAGQFLRVLAHSVLVCLSV